MNPFNKHNIEKQIISDKVDRDNDEILSCYNHFSLRYKERISEGQFTYGDYWNNWVIFLRGDYLAENDGRMYRMIGSYVKEEKI